MPLFRLTPIAAALVVYCAHADPVEPADPVAGQIAVEADHMSGVGSERVRAEGRVVAVRDDERVESDWLEYYQTRQHVRAGDRVHMTRGPDDLTGEALDYSMEASQGTLENADVYRNQPGRRGAPGYRAGGALVRMTGKDTYEISQSRFTTCEPGRDDWYVRAREMDLDYASNLGVARGAWVEFKGVPLLYTPWIDFPLQERRKSGLLAPTFKLGGGNGIEFAQPYYLNLAPNYDATVIPRVLSRRGLMLGGEFRYLMPDYNGQMAGEIMPDDRKRNGDTRFAYTLSHLQQAPSLNMAFGYNIRYASDNDYFRDFGDRRAIADGANLLREGWANWHSPFGFFTVKAQRYKTMQDSKALVDEPYARLPQLTWNYGIGLPAGVEANFYAEYNQFSHGQQVVNGGLSARQDGKRLTFYPSLSLPLQASYGFITPKVGLHYTEYWLSAQNAPVQGETGNYSRALPVASVDAGLVFERDSNWFGQSLTQTLEPRLYYLYIPYRDQSRLPNFDSARYDTSFAQLFNENHYAGGDRINNANQLTAAITSRFIDNDNGIERLRVSLGQRMYFDEQRVTLDANDVRRTKTLSDFLASVSGQLTRDAWMDTNYQYNRELGKAERYNLGLRYNPAPGKTLSLRWRYERDTEVAGAALRGPSRQIDIAGQWPIARKWYVVGRQNYSFTGKQSLETLLGVEYNDGCWAVRLVGQRYQKDLNTSTTAFYLQLELNGLGGIGSNPLQTLRQSIPGYSKINDVPGKL